MGATFPRNSWTSSTENAWEVPCWPEQVVERSRRRSCVNAQAEFCPHFTVGRRDPDGPYKSHHQPDQWRGRRERGGHSHAGQEPWHLGKFLGRLLGGGVGGTILQAIVPALAQGGGSDMGAIIGNIAGGGAGGGLLMILTSMIKKAFAAA